MPQPPPPEQQDANAAKLAEIKDAIHPMARAIPSLRSEIESILTFANVGRLRFWGENHRFHNWAHKWRACGTSEKPQLVSFLTALATFDALPHVPHCVFGVFVEHRKLREWAEEQIKARAAREGISLDSLLPKEPAEEGLPIKPECVMKKIVEPQTGLPAPQPYIRGPPEPSRQITSKPAKQPGTQLLKGPSETPKQKSTTAELQQTVSKPASHDVPTLLQQALAKTSQPSTSNAAQQTHRPPGSLNEENVCASSQRPMHSPNDGSVLPIKRSIECPAGAECPNILKRARTHNVGCQADAKYIDSANQANRAQETSLVLPAPPPQVETQSNTPEQPQVSNPNRESEIITAVEKLIKSNAEMQQSNMALQQSFHSSVYEMAAQGMHWQQQAAMMPPPNFYHMPDYRMMMLPQGPMAGMGWRGYPPPQGPAGGAQMWNGGRRSDVPEQREAANRAKKDGGNSQQSRYFG